MQCNREAQSYFECTQMTDMTTCILLVGLLEWRELARLIEWREAQVMEAEGSGNTVILKDILMLLELIGGH